MHSVPPGGQKVIWLLPFSALAHDQGIKRGGRRFPPPLTTLSGPGLSASLHELGLLSALRFIAQDKRPEIHVLGMEPETTDYGLDLTPAVKAALPRYIQIIRETVDRRRLGK